MTMVYTIWLPRRVELGSLYVWMKTLTDLAWDLEVREDTRSVATAQGMRHSHSPSSASPGHHQAVGSFLPSSGAMTGGPSQFYFHGEGKHSAPFTFSCLPWRVAGAAILTRQGGLLVGRAG